MLRVSNYFQIVFYNTVLYFACIYFLSLLRNNKDNLDSICYEEGDKSVISFLFNRDQNKIFGFICNSETHECSKKIFLLTRFPA